MSLRPAAPGHVVEKRTLQWCDASAKPGIAVVGDAVAPRGHRRRLWGISERLLLPLPFPLSLALKPVKRRFRRSPLAFGARPLCQGRDLADAIGLALRHFLVSDICPSS